MTCETSGLAPFDRITFDSFFPNSSPTPAETLAAINCAILYSSANMVPVYGLAKTYQIGLPASPDDSNNHIVAQSGAVVICDPFCVIERLYDSTNNRDFGFVGNPFDLIADDIMTVDDFTWIGGTFKGGSHTKTRTIDNIMYSYPANWKGRGVDLKGDRNKLIDLTIDTFYGIAMYLHGDDIEVRNPRIVNPYQGALDILPPPEPGCDEPEDRLPTSAGIRFGSGARFRCWGGYVESSGDAAIQFSNDGDENITDGAYIGTAGSSSYARFILVGTSQTGGISDVLFDACTGAGGLGSNAIKVQNEERNGPEESAISNVTFRDVTVSVPAGESPREAVAITNEIALPRAVNNIRFENLVVRNGSGGAFSISALGVGVVQYPVYGVTWSGGGVYPTDDGLASLAIDNAEDVVLEGIDIDAAGGALASGDRIVAVGATDHCRNVVLKNLRIRNLSANNSVGAFFGDTVNCGCEGGRIDGASNTKPIVIDAAAVGCFVERVDLADVATEPKIVVPSPLATPLRLERNYGSALRLGFVSTGSKVNVTPTLVTGGTYEFPARTGYVALATSGTITNIDGSQVGEGDLLTLTVQGSQTAMVKDNSVLRLDGDCPLSSNQDTLTLMRRTSDWVEISRSHNG